MKTTNTAHLKTLLIVLLIAALIPSAFAQTMPGMSTQAMPPMDESAAKKQAMPMTDGTRMKPSNMAGMKPGMSGMMPSGMMPSGMMPSGMMPSGMMQSMKSTTDLSDPMSQEGSGTSWLPASSPMYGYAEMHDGNTLMLHGAIAPRYVNVGSKRGDRRFDAPRWFMGMLSHPLDARSQIGVRTMISLDPIIEEWI